MGHLLLGDEGELVIGEGGEENAGVQVRQMVAHQQEAAVPGQLLGTGDLDLTAQEPEDRRGVVLDDGADKGVILGMLLVGVRPLCSDPNDQEADEQAQQGAAHENGQGQADAALRQQQKTHRHQRGQQINQIQQHGYSSISFFFRQKPLYNPYWRSARADRENFRKDYGNPVQDYV